MDIRRLIREFVEEELTTQSVVKYDDDLGDRVIRKLVKYHKPNSRYGLDDTVDAEVLPDGELDVDGVERWFPELEP